MSGSGILMASAIGYVVLLAIVAAVIVAWIMSISMIVDRAKERGCEDGRGKLWFIGLFVGPVLLALYVLTFGSVAKANPALGDGAERDEE